MIGAMIGFNRIRQSGILPFRFESGGLQVLLVSSLGTKRWIVPKGRLEPGLTARESAEYEAFEEAGVAGQLGSNSIGSFLYKKRDEKGGDWCRVRVYPMEVEQVFDEYPHAGLREREWMPIDSAVDAVTESGLKKLLSEFRERQSTSSV